MLLAVKEFLLLINGDAGTGVTGLDDRSHMTVAKY